MTISTIFVLEKKIKINKMKKNVIQRAKKLNKKKLRQLISSRKDKAH